MKGTDGGVKGGEGYRRRGEGGVLTLDVYRTVNANFTSESSTGNSVRIISSLIHIREQHR